VSIFAQGREQKRRGELTRVRNHEIPSLNGGISWSGKRSIFGEGSATSAAVLPTAADYFPLIAAPPRVTVSASLTVSAASIRATRACGAFERFLYVNELRWKTSAVAIDSSTCLNVTGFHV
jgi:hypothetical protein